METQLQAGTTREGGAFQSQRIHLIGIGGSGMRALAAMLLDRGATVSGSDVAGGGAVDRLAEQGASVIVGHRPENVPAECDAVVFSAAVKDQNPELLAAEQRGIEIVKYAEMLGRLMAEKTGIAIAGTHGKSTTTALVSYVLRQAGVDPSYIVGATVDQLGGPSGVGQGKHFVAEACEFDRSFLHLRPHYAAILNVEEDHLDCYRDLDAIVEAFRAFGSNVRPDGVVVVNGDDRNAVESIVGLPCEVETFGLSEECTWRGAGVTRDRGRIRMEIRKDGQPFGQVLVPLPGLHNAYNVLAAVALLHHAGLTPEDITRHIETFGGAKRRLTLKAQVGGVTVVDDFAHHPTEIQASLRAMSDYYRPRRIICVFQPHQHSRTRFLLKDFAASFALADEVIVPDIYFVRDSEAERNHVSSKDLVAQIRLRGGVAIYLKTFALIVEYLKGVLEEGDLVVTMGAGNIWEVADEIVHWLGNNR